jgi:hypothetical protein
MEQETEHVSVLRGEIYLEHAEKPGQQTEHDPSSSWNLSLL